MLSVLKGLFKEPLGMARTKTQAQSHEKFELGYKELDPIVRLRSSSLAATESMSGR